MISLRSLVLATLLWAWCTSGNLQLNEWLGNSGKSDDWIEVYNPTDAIYPIDGYGLSDKKGEVKYTIPNDQSIPAKGYWTINQFNNGFPPYFGTVNGSSTGFGISSTGESLYIFSDPTFLIVEDSVSFDGSRTGQTYGRWITSTGASHTALLSRATKGQPNAYPYVGSVVLVEINYQPTTKPVYVAVKNTDSSPVKLYHNSTQQSWKVSGLGFTFPFGTTLEPGQIAYLCAASVDASDFKTAWSDKFNGVTPQPLVFCEFNGTLNSKGDSFTLYSVSMDGNDTLEVPEDVVTFSNETLGTNPNNYTLVRVSEVSYGNDKGNWVSSGTVPKSCTKASDCLNVDNCTVAACTGSKCVYSLSTEPPICAAPPAPAPGSVPAPSEAPGSAPGGASTTATTTGATVTTGSSNPEPASSDVSREKALFGLLFVAVFLLF